jgi:hypothetical protein
MADQSVSRSVAIWSLARRPDWLLPRNSLVRVLDLDLDLVLDLDVDAKKPDGVMLNAAFAKAFLERMVKVQVEVQVHVQVEVQVQVYVQVDGSGFC